MSTEVRCDQVRELAPELALDIADGQERGLALRHVERCVSCRAFVADLSSLMDDLLLLAPEHEPPDGFRERVLARIAGPQALPPPRRWTRPLTVAAAFLLALVLGAGSVMVATSDDRRIAGSYRSVLAAGEGSFFTVAPLEATDGAGVGTVWGYEGSPSWLFISLASPPPRRLPSAVVVWTDDGTRAVVGTADFGPDRSGWGVAIPMDLRRVRVVRIAGVGTATIMPQDPWG
jgi:hypothetical protein